VSRLFLPLCAAAVVSACGSTEPSTPPGTTSATTTTTIDPACDDALACVPTGLPLPAGVTADPRDREAVLAAAGSWDLPADVTFTINTPVRTGDRIVVRGELTNTSSEPRTVFLTEAGVGYFHATLVSPGLVRRPVPPPAPGITPRPVLFPEPHAFVLAPGARWPFETAVVVSCWEPAPGTTVGVHHWLNVEGESIDGEQPIVL